MKTRKRLGYGVLSVGLLWILTAVIGVPQVVRTVEGEQATSGWGGAGGSQSDSVHCTATALAVFPLLVYSSDACWDARGSGVFMGGYEEWDLHLWYLVGQAHLFRIGLAET